MDSATLFMTRRLYYRPDLEPEMDGSYKAGLFVELTG
jgi:hypothetical protein